MVAQSMSRDYHKKMWSRRPSWELSNMVKALETLPWLNAKEDEERLEIAKEILKERRSKGS